jgi:predicted Zn-dependent peptidase
MKRILKIGMVILGLVFFLSFISLADPLAKAPRVKKAVLPNGLTVLVKEDHKAPIVALEAFIKVGAEYETDRLCGIRNFCQSLILKGTKTMSAFDIALQLESAGGLIDTSTAPDYIEVSVVARPEGLKVGLDILADVIRNPVFPEQEVVKERRVILAQIDKLNDDKFESAYDLFKDTLYQGHPYSRPILGTKQSVEAIGRDDLVAFHKSHYLANETIIAVAGDVKANYIIREISQAFESFTPKAGSSPQQAELVEPKKVKSTKVIKARKVKQAFLILGFLAPSVGAKDYPALKVINTILGSGMSSRLFEDLRGVVGLAYEVGSFFPTRKGPSHYCIYLGTRPENLSRAKELVIAEIKRIKDELVSGEELARAKSFCLGSFALDHQQNSRQAWHLGWYELLGLGFDFDSIYPSLVEQVTSEDVRRAAKKYFNCHTLVVLRPTENR